MDEVACYPEVPGTKERDGTASRDAATGFASEARRLQDAAYRCLLQLGPQTADEIAEQLRKDRLAIRPRLTELKQLGLVRKTELRRKNASGMKATVWEAIRVQQRLF